MYVGAALVHSPINLRTFLVTKTKIPLHSTVFHDFVKRAGKPENAAFKCCPFLPPKRPSAIWRGKCELSASLIGRPRRCTHPLSPRMITFSKTFLR